MLAPVLLWFRDDLRLADNPALLRAVETAGKSGSPLLAFYVLDEVNTGVRSHGGASRWWLHHSLAALSADIEARGGRLALFRGNPERIISDLFEQFAPQAIFWNRRYEAGAIALDTKLKSQAMDRGIQAESFNAALLYEPWLVKGKSGDPLRVFSPFWRAALASGEPAAPLPSPGRLPAPPTGPAPAHIELADLGLLPVGPDWALGLRTTWTPGEAGAAQRLSDFLAGPIAHYAQDRDRPDMSSTSGLSPHLRFGEIGPRQIWHAVDTASHAGSTRASAKDVDKFKSELGWREFSYSLLFYNPELSTRNFQPRFDAFPWKQNDRALRAWQKGRTGYPIVDAGMRQLWQIGWMHNRVRMIVASFLIKHLLIDWREGERWFWDTLVDADPANNAASWQWVAGSGADAAPYFRIFNPMTQGERFDPDGDYVRCYVPELASLDASVIHSPWTATPMVLASAGVKLGETYPHPIIPHDKARARALAAFEVLKGDVAVRG